MAADRGVAELCVFRRGDIRNAAVVVPAAVPADVAVFGALGDVLGPLDKTVGILRSFVKPGGFLVISDDYVKKGGSTNFPGFENYGSRDETISRLESHGDVLVKVIEESSEGIAARRS